MPSPKPFNMDAVVSEKIAANAAKAEIRDFDLLGRTWHATTAPSVTAVLDAMNDPTGASAQNFLLSMIVPEERVAFKDTMAMTVGFDGDVFSEVLNNLAELVAERPTEPSSASSPTSRSRTSGSRSTVNSSVADSDSLD